MNLQRPNAVAAMNNEVAAVGDDGDSWEVIGEPLTDQVDKTVPEYNTKLDLDLDPSAGKKRAEIATLRWGKIEKDVARLRGLVKAIENVSQVVAYGRGQLAHEWKGEAFEAFSAALLNVEKTLNDYATAVTTTADGMAAALTAIRQFHTEYRDASVETHLNFDGCAPPHEWKRMTTGDADFLADHCTCIGNCFYNDDAFLPLMDRKLVTKELFDQLEKWDCTHNADVVTGQYKYVVGEAHNERTTIQGKIHKWYKATDELKKNVDDALKASLENLRILSEVKVFSALSVPGAAAPGGGGPGAGGDPGPGGGGDPGPGGGGYPGGGGSPDAAMPPIPEPPEPAPTEPAADAGGAPGVETPETPETPESPSPPRPSRSPTATGRSA